MILGLGNTIPSDSVRQGLGGGVSYLLDNYGTNIGGAYSFRKLSSTYTGECIRVRRSSDNAEADIGFNGDYLDEVALLAHTGTRS